ncbi:MAG: lipid-A-disaccharide synthase [Muribaculaceae bacterium]|nr:lipid-A-disaccharide synthase [Muribaculaceae bacterium]
MHYFISAGEASGDIHASRLIADLKKADPEAVFTFLGGDLMAKEAGVDPLIHYREMAYMGFSEVIRNLNKVLGNLSIAKRSLHTLRPDALILVDYPSFNLRLAETASKIGIPVFYYISPKVWAWKEGRVKKIKKYCRRVLSILPFEVDFYKQKHGYDVDYVGNPTLAEVEEKKIYIKSKSGFCREYSLDPDKPILALVPGSRVGEIRNNLPVMVQVARRHDGMQAVIAGAPGIDSSIYQKYSDCKVVEDATFELMAIADAALVTSGTATLECALLGTPQVACYRSNGSRLVYSLFRRILKIPYVTLPNLIADREVIPEMLLHHCNQAEVDAKLSSLLGSDGKAAAEQREGYDEIRRRLSSARIPAAELIYRDLRSDKK